MWVSELISNDCNYRLRSLGKQGDIVLGSVRPSDSQRLGVCLCVCNQWACVDSHTDAVDRLLID